MASRWPRLAAVLLAATAITATIAFAQPSSYPNRPVRFIVPLAPGGGADVVARIIAERLSRGLGQQVLVDNRGGGGTVIGADLAAKSPADGYTWLLGTATTHAINASLMKKLPYDPVRDFAPVALVAASLAFCVARSRAALADADAAVASLAPVCAASR